MVKTSVLRTPFIAYVIVMLMQSSCLSDSYRIELSGPITIGNEWIEFRPEPPLRAEKDFQSVALELESPFMDSLANEPNRGKGILMPDGEVINPEIEVIDQRGNTFNLVYEGSTGGVPIYGLPYPNKLPRDREYKAVRIRSSKPIKSKAIYWFCESSQDWH